MIMDFMVKIRFIEYVSLQTIEGYINGVIKTTSDTISISKEIKKKHDTLQRFKNHMYVT